MINLPTYILAYEVQILFAFSANRSYFRGFLLSFFKEILGKYHEIIKMPNNCLELVLRTPGRKEEKLQN